MTAAEKIPLPTVLVRVDRGNWIHLHAADRIFRSLPAFVMGAMLHAGDIIRPVCLVVAHQCFSYRVVRW
jgi:hypothetical protein